MAVTRQFTEPLQVVDTPVMVERLDHLSDVRQISRAKVVREMLADRIDAAEQAAGITDGEERAQAAVTAREAVRDSPETVAHSE